jgi:N-hydroxyarylamine O-acetyltransferase
MPDSAQLWRPERLDLPAYLRRIGFDGAARPDAGTLTALHRAHVAAVPFENLDVVLGRGIDPDLDAVQDKLVARRRGGYCFEHATLFGAALDRLGFRVDRLLARTGDPLEHPRPRSHMVLSVEAEGRRWLADVGFGSGLLTPLPLAATGPHRQGGWTYELATGPDGAWRLREHDGATWTTIQTFTEEAQYPVDIEVANHFTATEPGSPFRQRVVIVRKDEAGVRRLIGRELSVQKAGRPAEQQILDDEGFAGALRAELGDALSDEDVAALVALR